MVVFSFSLLQKIVFEKQLHKIRLKIQMVYNQEDNKNLSMSQQMESTKGIMQDEQRIIYKRRATSGGRIKG
jgi:hypothetical protein